MTGADRAGPGFGATHVALVGMMGSGKSTVGPLLARILGRRFCDTDDEVCRRRGASVPDIWRNAGEAGFRAEEATVLDDLLASDDPSVISVAGGAVLAPRNRRRLRDDSVVVWLRAELTTLVSRVGSGSGRPLLAGDAPTALARLDAVRRPLYRDVADLTVDVDRIRAADVTDAVLDQLATLGASHVDLAALAAREREVRRCMS